MKKLLLTVSIFFLIGCGEKKDDSFKCNAIPAEITTLHLGDNVSQIPLFMNTMPETFSTNNYCSKTFIFNQFNETSFSWCYYYSIQTDCAGNVEHIYNGGH